MFVDGSSTRPSPANAGRGLASRSASADPAGRRLAPVEDLELDSLDREIGELAADISAATCRWLLLVAEFDRRGGYEQWGYASCATWLAWRCSIASRAAYENLRVARSLTELPRITAGFSAGRLSYSKVRALTRVAEPDNERELLELAEHATASQLERIITGYRNAISAGDAEEARARRHFSTRWEPDGTLRLTGNLPAEEGALLLEALAIVEEKLRSERIADGLADGQPATPEQEQEQVERVPAPSAADALVAIAEAALAGGSMDVNRGGGDRHQVVVHVDLADLRIPSDAGDAAGIAVQNGMIADQVPIAPETVKRLGCDAAVVAIIERDGAPISVGRKTRSVPPSIARALRARDRGCRFPGCGSRRFVDAHHVRHWAEGGETSLSNLIQLCHHHHRLVHEGGFSVEMHGEGAGEVTFRRPDGVVVPAVPKGRTGSTAACIRTARRFGGAGIDGSTIAARSRGEPFDLDLTVFTLASRRRE
jgi:hypothetical protein